MAFTSQNRPSTSFEKQDVGFGDASVAFDVLAPIAGEALPAAATRA
ncbi:hypothetical protein [uncultured Sphingomonas sp.]|nr:hypothetical protein [uncultured Sphingomonas sp.]